MIKQNKRKCGILMHPTSFPSLFGIGDLGLEAYEFLSFLSSCNVRLWQILPLGPTGYGNSPYSSRSCFAGNEYLIDLNSIPKIKTKFVSQYSTSKYVDYNYVNEVKLVLLKQAAEEFAQLNHENAEYEAFCEKNSFWLNDYALYRALTDFFKDSRWFLWDKKIKDRDKQTIEKYEKNLKKEIHIYKVLQFFFFTQWNNLHQYAKTLNIEIIGDVPIYASADSVDVWTHRNLFKQDACAGVPPDAFSAEGQLWGNPVYNWNNHEKENYHWWRERISHLFKMVDIVRIDHFRGLESYWEIPAGSKTAASGSWKKGPAMKMLKYFKDCKIIAEDLGIITDEVQSLLEQTGWPGMKVLQFAFELSDGKLKNNMYLPHNYEKNCVAYTGTHDNQTSRGWFNSLPDSYKDIVRRYLQSPDEDVVWQMIRILLSSSADTVVIPMQDILGLDDNARMNLPSSVGRFNWSWKMQKNDIQPWMKDRLREYINLYGR